ncbi:hemagglutinin repeat-containing protein [Stenotrophomonas sp. SRS1]|uniref:hemagglutinin repeat-containing protein n=1 Tax=Stenotrophomonas sp. SRS1 TaxID=2870345 RepID=UPI002238426C|nr:hemagglutinin repeat-containing protein [Stenotrophomonas sp. SRS1]MCW6029519.1 hemagglutinin repeat-containing protein [Stenotrophomonas sp. SRS1]
MNRVYRLVFNRTLGVMQVASELVTAPRGGCDARGGNTMATLRPMSFALWLVLGWVGLVQPLSAQQVPDAGRIIADPGAPAQQRPTVITSANGTPQVNITTPSAAGVSRNQYQQLDVGRQGVILNNSRTDVQTQIGGWVQGNPWLATGTARVILNEVNGSNPSHLNGYVEVAGARAQVVIANPAGIQIDGAGFLNASRVTLTTGTPILNNGALDGYRVEGGAIRVSGAGLDASLTDYTDIITRSLQVNAGIWANQLQASLGTNVVSADHSSVTAQAPAGGTPAFALDVGALGGMYANRIWLVGNEHGVGMSNAGKIGAQAGELVVTADGRLENTGALHAQQDTRITAAGGVANAGTLSAERELRVDTPADLDNSGGTLNARRIEVNADALRNRGGSIEQVGAQTLQLSGTDISNEQGRIGTVASTSPGQETGGGTTGGTTGQPGSGSTPGTGTPTPGQGGTGGTTPPTPTAPLAAGALNIATSLDNDGGAIDATGILQLSAGNSLDNSRGTLGVQTMQVQGDALRNVGGRLEVQGAASAQVQTLDNSGGHMALAQTFQLQAQSLFNRGGTLAHGGSAATAWSIGTLDNSDGSLASNATTFGLDLGHLINTRGSLSHAGSNGLQLRADRLDGVQGTIATAGDIALQLGSADHRKAQMIANQVSLAAGDFDNRGGRVLSTGQQVSALSVQGTLDNGDGGTLASNGDLQITAAQLGNAGGTVQQAGTGSLRIDAVNLQGQGGTVLSNGSLVVQGDTTNLRDGTTSAQRIAITTGDLITAGGTLTSAGTEVLDLQVARTLDNTGGTLGSNGALAIDSTTLINTGGKLIAAGTGQTTLHASEALHNQGGTLSSNGDLRIDAERLLNGGGSIDHAGNGTLQITTASLSGGEGTIASNGLLQLQAQTLDLHKATTRGREVDIRAGALDNTGGTLLSLGEQAMQLRISGSLVNDGGTLTANGAQQIEAGALTNRGGALNSAGTADTRLIVAGTLDNTGGTVASNAGALQLQAGALVNADGTISHAGQNGLSITTGRLDGQRGRIGTAGALELSAGAVDHRGASVAAEQLDITAQSLDNRGGSIIATGTAANTLQVTDTLDNGDGGTLASNGDLSISASTLGNAGGTIQQAGTGTLAIKVDTLNGHAGTLLSNGALDLQGDTLDLRNGTTSAQQIRIDSERLITAGGQLRALGTQALQVQARALLDNSGGTLGSNGAVDINAGRFVNDHGKLIAAGEAASQVRVTQLLDNTGGAISGNGDLRIEAEVLRNADGTLVAADALHLQGQTLDLRDGAVGATQITVQAGSLDNSGGTLSATGTADMRLQVREQLTNDTGTIAANGAQHIEAGALSNRGGTLSSAGTGNSQIHVAGQLDNSKGVIASNAAALEVATGSLRNIDGTLSHAGTQGLTLSTGQLLGQDGHIVTAGALTLTAGEVDHRGATLQATQIALAAEAFDNRGGQLVATGTQANHIDVAGALDNGDDGLIASNGDLTLNAALLGNAGGTVQQAGNGLLAINAATLNGAGGTLLSNGTLHVQGDTTDLRAGTTSAQRIRIETGDLTTAGGTLTATSTDALALQVRGRLDNTGGTVATNGALDLRAATLLNNGGNLQAAGTAASQLSIDQALQNRGGKILTSGDLNVTAASLDNQGGTVHSATDLSVGVDGLLDNSNTGLIASGGDAQLRAATLDNRSGSIEQAGEGQLQIDTGTLQGAGGRIISNGALTLQGDALDIRGGTTAARQVTVTAGSLDNAGGTLSSTGEQTMVLQVRDALGNDGGTIAANGAQQISAGTLSNVAGTLSSAGTADTRIEVAGQFDNTRGTLASNGGALTVQTGSLVNDTGRIHHAGQNGLTLQTGSLQGQKGSIATAGTLTLRADAIDHRDATLSAGQLDIVATALDNRGGTVLSTGTQANTVRVDGTLDNGDDGTLASNGDLQITAATLGNAGGTVQQAGTGTLSITAATLNGQGGTLVSNGALALAGDTTDLRNGTTSAQQIRIDTGDLTTAGGNLFATGTGPLALNVRNRLDNTGGTLASNGTVDLHAATLINNQGTLQAAGAGSNQLQVGQALENRGGRILATGATVIGAASVDNHGGTLQTGGALTLGVDGRLDNSGQGVIASGGDAHLTAATLDNQTGSIEHAGEGTLAIEVTDLHGAGGRIVGNGALQLKGDTLDLSGATTGARQVTVTAGSLDTSKGTLTSTGTQAMTLQVDRALTNNGGTIAANGAQQITAGALSNIDGTLSAAGTGDTRINVLGTFDNTRGDVASNGRQLQIDAARLINEQGTLSHGGTESLSLTVGQLDGAKGTIVSAGALALQAGAVDHRGATLNATQLTVQADAFNNQGGTVLATGAQASSLTVSGVLDNGNGGTLASNGDLQITAATLGNAGGTVQQAGTGTLAINAHTLNGQGGKLLSNGSLALIGENTDLRDGTTAAQRIRIETGELVTAGGTLTATGTDVLALNVRGRLDNTAGTLASNGTLDLRAAQLLNNQGTVQAAGAGSNQLAIGGALENRGGRLLTTGNATVTATGLDNRGGTLHSDGSSRLTVTVDGLLDNSAQGTVSSGGNAHITTQSLNNEAGTLAAGAALQLDTATQVRNTNGLIQAGTDLRVTSSGIDNHSGRIIAGTVDLDTRGYTLDNRAGTVASLTGGAALRTGQLDNSGGLLQSAGNLRIDTAGQALINTNANGNGINSSGTLEIHSGAFDNRAGSVFGQGAITVTASSVDNTAGGALVGAGDLTLRAQSVANAGGKITVGRNADIVLPGALDNRGGLVAAGGTLALQAGNIDNRYTLSAPTGPALGLQGKHLQLGTGSLDNQQGQILADTLVVQVSGLLNNSGGQISAAETSDIRADSIANAGGSLVAGSNQIVRTREITGDGKLLSQGDMTLELGQSHINTGELAANGTLTLAIQGNLDNLGKLQGAGVNISAGNIHNAASGEISSVGLTRLVASGELLNRGLLDGRITHIDAGTLNNIGTGRIYGDHIAIQAGTLNNLAENVGGAQRSATIAARQRLDLGVGVLNNRGQSLIFSDGDAAIGGALNGLTAVGSAQRIDNLSSTIEIAGNLDMSALAVNNIRENVVVQQQTIQHGPVTLNQPGWFKNGRNTGNLRETSNFQPYEVYYLNPDDILEDTAYITPDGQQIRRAVVRLTANTSAYYFARGGLNGSRGERSRLPAQDGTVVIYYVGRADSRNNPDQLGAGAEDPFRDLSAMPPGSRDGFNYESDTLAYNNAYGTCTTTCVRLITYPDYDNPEAMLINMQRHTTSTNGNEKTRVATRTTTEDVLVSAGADAVINAGGHMRIATDALRNEYASIAAGGNLAVVGLNVGESSIINTAKTLFRTHSFSNVSITYGGSRSQWSAAPISEQIGVLGAGITAGGKLSIDVGNLRNENTGRDAPNVRDGDSMANLNTGGPGAGSVGPGAGAVQGPGQSSGQGAGPVNAQGPTAAGAAHGQTGSAVQGPGQAGGHIADGAHAQGPSAAGGAQGAAGQGLQGADRTSGQLADAANAQGPSQVGSAGPGTGGVQDIVAGQAAQATATGPGAVQAGGHAGSGGNAALANKQAVAAAGNDPHVVVTTTPNASAPSASLFNVDANRGSYLVETDPRFASYRSWLSSDYLLQRAGYEPSQTQKRLGDGFYEQKLVREQIGELTGRRFLDGHASDEDQYRALLEAGATVASAWGLRPGVALTAEQMARLTSDIVWLVEQDVTLADGSTVRALVPQVYLRVMPGDLDTNGALLAGADIDIKLRGDLVNSGAIAGRQLVSIDAGNIRNVSGGQISGQQVGLQATHDIDIIGSTVTATDALGLKAGGNITVASTTREWRDNGDLLVQQTTTLDRVAGLYVTNKDGAGVLSVNAGGNVELRAAQLANAGTDGLTAIVAGGDLSLTSVAEQSSVSLTHDARNFNSQSQSINIGTTISGAGDVVLKAGNDLNLTAANVSAANALVAQAGRDINSVAVVDTRTFDSGAKSKNGSREVSAADGWVLGNQLTGAEGVALQAGRDLTLQATTVDSSDGGVLLSAGRNLALTTAQETHDLVVDETTRKKKTLSSTTTTTHDQSSASYAVGSTIGGKTVDMIAGNDVTITGSTVLADNDLRIAAANNITIESAQDTYSEASSFSQKKSGITGGFGNGVASVGYSSAKSDNQSASQSTTQVGSAVGSMNGNVQLNAGNQLTIAASDVAAGQDLTLIGKDINLLARQDTVDSQISQSSKSSGFSMGVTYDPTKAYRSARDSTTDGMADSGSIMGDITRNAEGTASGVRAATTSVVVTGGSQRSSGNQVHSTSDARVAQLSAGGDLTVIANGGSIYSQGAQMAAEGDALLLATKDIVFDVAHNTESSTSQSSGKGWGFANNTSGLPFGTNNSRSDGSGQSDTITGTQLSVGGGVRMATTEGDITLTAANIAAEKDVTIRAAGNLTVQSGQDTVSNANTADSKAIGTVQISDTEKFAGWHRQQHDDDSGMVSQVASTIGSLGGNVNLGAGGKYTQIASNVVAAQDVNITAAEIELLTANETGYNSQSDKDLKIGVFARIKSPFIDLINNVDSARQSDGRLQAMQGMAAGANAYQAGSAIASAAKGGGASLLSAEAGIGFKSASSSADGSSTVSRGSTIQGGGNVNLTSTSGDIHVVQGNLSAGNTLSLDSARDILLEAGQANLQNKSKSNNAGAEVGVGVSVGAQTGVYVYAEASVGSSKSSAESSTWQNTTLIGSNISLKADGDTTLRGATATADRIDVKTGGTLTIQSMQDIAESMSKENQVGGRVQVSFGTAWDASGYASVGKANGSYKGVGEQSGLFAGDGGYHVDAGHVNLVGGAIASTNAANSELSAETFTFTDLKNEMDYRASSAGISGGFGSTGNAATDANGDPVPAPGAAGQFKDIGSTIRNGEYGAANSTSFSPGIPMSDSGHDSSTTYATLTGGNITIGGRKVDAADLGVNTDASAAHQALEGLPDLQKMLQEQRAMAQATGTVVDAGMRIRAGINASIDEENARKEDAKKQLADPALRDSMSQEQKAQLIATAVEADREIERLQKVGVLVGAITGGIAASSGSTGQIVAGTLAPVISYQIGQYFKENAARNEMDNGKRGEEGSATHLLAHALLGAAVASAGGDSAMIGALAAGGAEAAAPAIAKFIFGKDSKDLSSSEQDTVSAVAGIGGAMLGSLQDGMLGAIAGSSAAKNAVENNWSEVGHYSTMATILYLSGFSEQDAKAVALAAWSPDTDNRNAITKENVANGDSPTGNQKAYHLLTGEKDPAKVAAIQNELAKKVKEILTDLKRYENNPESKAAILSNAENQRILHAFGDSFAHVQADGTHYDGGQGHLKDGTDPDEPNKHPGAFTNYVESLYAVASSVAGPNVRSNDVSTLTATVVAKKSNDDQKAALAAAAAAYGGKDPALVDSPIAGCEWYQRCGGNIANEAIRKVYGVTLPVAPQIDWSKLNFPSDWTRR